MTTSNPGAPQPAGGAHPDGEDHDDTVDPLVRPGLEGAVPDEELGEGDPAAGADPEADSVEDDRRESGAD